MVPGCTPQPISNEDPILHQCWKWLLLLRGKTQNYESNCPIEIMRHTIVRYIQNNSNIFRYLAYLSNFAILVREQNNHLLCFLYRKMLSKIQRNSQIIFEVLPTHHLRIVYLDNNRMAWNKGNDPGCFPAGKELH